MNQNPYVPPGDVEPARPKRTGRSWLVIAFWLILVAILAAPCIALHGY